MLSAFEPFDEFGGVEEVVLGFGGAVDLFASFVEVEVVEYVFVVLFGVENVELGGVLFDEAEEAFCFCFFAEELVGDEEGVVLFAVGLLKGGVVGEVDAGYFGGDEFLFGWTYIGGYVLCVGHGFLFLPFHAMVDVWTLRTLCSGNRHFGIN